MSSSEVRLKLKATRRLQASIVGFGAHCRLPLHPAYNPYFSACFFNQDSVFLSQQISQQCFSVGLSAQPNGAYGDASDA
jgi:hypothetical protein